MARDVISTCPICEHELSVTRLNCRNCGTSLEGEFSVGRFGRLTREQLSLLESFLRSRGNLRELERELGISYPTVRGRIDSLIRALGISDEPTAAEAGAAEDDAIEAASHAGDNALHVAAEARRALLERVARGELKAEEGVEALRALSDPR